ncbi:sialate:O-sulfotransferase 2-like isoform X2 [Hypanus sabinus]|uniref:sialate:O-sulfotransferase 2-like isoform X2 n=1 Tax=Hypanus sabinus TaxID=79690 RepID=UPI0028C4CAB3|nr:sialate:O-sulfotransferase 2-like isoform X2 [Hypanus sabinus]
MARLAIKIHRCFRRKPLRFFTFIMVYLMAGSLVFLHSGFVEDSTITGRASPHGEGTAHTALGAPRGLQQFSFLPFGRSHKEAPEKKQWPEELPALPRRYGPPWLKPVSQDALDKPRSGEHIGSWSRALKGKMSRDQEENRAKYIGCYLDTTKQRALRGTAFFDYRKMTIFRCQDNCAERGYQYAGLEFGAECYCGHKIQAQNTSDSECSMECKGEKSSTCGGPNRLSVYRLELTHESARRYGNALFRGCFKRPDSVSLALPTSSILPNMSVDKCVDYCTEKDYTLAVLGGETCHCGFPTMHFTLHDPEDEHLCTQKCTSEEYEHCGNAEYYVVYQTQVQDNRCMDRRFLPIRSKRLVALASFPGAGNTWSRHLMELTTGYYTGSYYFDGSLYNKEWPEFVRNYAPWWASHTLDWLKYGKEVLVVHYEDLKHDLFNQLKKMVSILGLSVSDDRLLCVESQKDGNFKRSGLRKLEYDPYTPEMRKMIDSFVKIVDVALKLRNLTGVPEDYAPR